MGLCPSSVTKATVFNGGCLLSNANHYDEEIKLEDETIGIILCKEKH